jgi:hypothetical protein
MGVPSFMDVRSRREMSLVSISTVLLWYPSKSTTLPSLRNKGEGRRNTQRH